MPRLNLSQSLLREIKDKIQENREVEIGDALALNAALLDTLYRLSLVNLTEDEFDYLESSLRKVPYKVTEYLLVMWKNVVGNKTN